MMRGFRRRAERTDRQTDILLTEIKVITDLFVIERHHKVKYYLLMLSEKIMKAIKHLFTTCP